MRASIRAAVDQVDQGLMAFQSEPFNGVVRVAAHGALNEQFVLPALLELRRRHPSFTPDQTVLADKDVAKALAQGEVDMVFCDEPVEGEGIACELIGSYSVAVYCGRTHPLYGSDGLDRERMVKQPFCAPSGTNQHRSPDGWPRAWPRHVAMRVTILPSAVQVVREGELLAVLPDVAVAGLLATGEVYRLPRPELPARPVYCATSGIDGRRPSAQAIRARVRQRLVAQRDRESGTFLICEPGAERVATAPADRPERA
jgi:DNA-binding transcriptional LysR family regulator